MLADYIEKNGNNKYWFYTSMKEGKYDWMLSNTELGIVFYGLYGESQDQERASHKATILLRNGNPLIEAPHERKWAKCFDQNIRFWLQMKIWDIIDNNLNSFVNSEIKSKKELV